MLISIITPSYNQADFIERTILSIKNQSYKYIEHIVIDGGSKDETINILKKYQDEYNLIWYSEKDDGQSDAVNKGLKILKGNIVGWLNSDDCYFANDTIERIVHFFQNQVDVGLVYGNNAEINEDNTILRFRKGFKHYHYNILKSCNFINQPTVFMRREIIRNINLDNNLNFAMDYDLWLKLGSKYKFKYIDEVIAAARKHRNCKTVTNPGRVQEENELVRSRYQPDGYINIYDKMLWKIIYRYQIVCGGFLVDRHVNKVGVSNNFHIDSYRKLILRHYFPRKMWKIFKLC